MPRDFLPSRESQLVTWSTNFKTKTTAAPADYGLTAAQATTYGAKHDDFVGAYQTANDPDTRSPSNIIAKNTAKDGLIEEARLLARIVQAAPGVTAEQKSELGLTVRDVDPTPIPAPTEMPKIDFVSVVGRVVKIRLHDGTGSRRGKPEGVAGAAVFTFVGEAPPNEIEAWKFEGNTTKTVVDVEFDASLQPGTKVYLTAFWFNPRAQSGPACAPVSTVINFGGLTQAA